MKPEGRVDRWASLPDDSASGPELDPGYHWYHGICLDWSLDRGPVNRPARDLERAVERICGPVAASWVPGLFAWRPWRAALDVRGRAWVVLPGYDARRSRDVLSKRDAEALAPELAHVRGAKHDWIRQLQEVVA